MSQEDRSEIAAEALSRTTADSTGGSDEAGRCGVICEVEQALLKKRNARECGFGVERELVSLGDVTGGWRRATEGLGKGTT